MTTLVIAAHPDDEVLGCGGTIARKTASGGEVHVAILGEGLTSRTESGEAANETGLANLRDQSRSAGEILGAADITHFGLPDNRFDEVPLLEIARTVEELIRRIRPQEIFTQHGGDLNIDHSATFRATLIAARPTVGQVVRAVYAYEVPSSTEWAFMKFEPRFSPDLFVDISTTLDHKVRAMEKYESERRQFPHPRSPTALEAIARRWGSVVGVDAAEAFETVWKVE